MALRAEMNFKGPRGWSVASVSLADGHRSATKRESIGVGDIELVSTVVVLSLTGGVRLALAPVDAVAEHWKDRIKARLDRTAQSAREKAGDRSLEASERIMFKVLTEAASSDDEIVAEYLGGVLAASGPDDSAASIVGQIGRLSSRELRLHFSIYRELHRLLHLPNAPILQDINNDWHTGRTLELFVDLDELRGSVGLPLTPDGVVGLQTALRSLAREQLVAPYGGHGMTFGPAHEGFMVASAHDLEAYVGNRSVPSAGVIVRPTVTGMTMMVWGVGARDPSPATFQGLPTISPSVPTVPTCPSAVLVATLPRKS
jgi:hypothetical protein